MIKYLLLIIFIEALTEILVESSILSKPREYLAQKNGLLGELIHCGYCTSVWVAASIAWVAPLAFTSYFLLNYFITVFILHRLSNLLHEAYSKFLGRRPMTFAVHKTETVMIPDLGGSNERQD
jgi:hypothetical protein